MRTCWFVVVVIASSLVSWALGNEPALVIGVGLAMVAGWAIRGYSDRKASLYVTPTFTVTTTYGSTDARPWRDPSRANPTDPETHGEGEA